MHVWLHHSALRSAAAPCFLLPLTAAAHPETTASSVRIQRVFIPLKRNTAARSAAWRHACIARFFLLDFGWIRGHLTLPFWRSWLSGTSVQYLSLFEPLKLICCPMSHPVLSVFTFSAFGALFLIISTYSARNSAWPMVTFLH